MKLGPTLHPAGILRAGDWPTIAIVAEDLRRVLAESDTVRLLFFSC